MCHRSSILIFIHSFILSFFLLLLACRLMLGSNSMYVLEHVSCPVMIVHWHIHHDGHPPPPPPHVEEEEEEGMKKQLHNFIFFILHSSSCLFCFGCSKQWHTLCTNGFAFLCTRERERRERKAFTTHSPSIQCCFFFILLLLLLSFFKLATLLLDAAAAVTMAMSLAFLAAAAAGLLLFIFMSGSCSTMRRARTPQYQVKPLPARYRLGTMPFKTIKKKRNVYNHMLVEILKICEEERWWRRKKKMKLWRAGGGAYLCLPRCSRAFPKVWTYSKFSLWVDGSSKRPRKYNMPPLKRERERKKDHGLAIYLPQEKVDCITCRSWNREREQRTDVEILISNEEGKKEDASKKEKQSKARHKVKRV